jgi:aspartyl/asparaginyl beta-hydroxylase (cupin superfamily)
VHKSTDLELHSLLQAAQQATNAGRLDEGAKLWERSLALAPAHPTALLRLGQHCLYRKELKGALELLQRAAVAAPQDPLVYLNLGFAYRALGNIALEAQAIERALANDAYCYPALLLKGALLERQGKRRAAARVYKDAIAIVPRETRLPDDLAAQVAHARDVVHQNAEELDGYLESALKEIRTLHRNAPLDRFDTCRDVMLGRKQVFLSQPTMLNFPGLPAIQYYHNEDFPWLREVEAETATIRDEFMSLLGEDEKPFRPYVNHRDGVPLNQWVELNRSPRWSAYFLWEDGAENSDHSHRCPETSAILRRLPLCNIPRFAPAAFFSTIEPGTRIPPHTGVTNARLIVHLALVVPDGCGFRVGNDSRPWREGKAWVFDDTIEHEAWNKSRERRALLIFDIWNPFLSEGERDLVGALLNATRDYYADE